MTKKDLRRLAAEIEECLDDDLDFDLNYEISYYTEMDTAIVDVCIGDPDDGWPDDWDEQVEDVISSVASDWGGWYSWEDSCISVSVPD